MRMDVHPEVFEFEQFHYEWMSGTHRTVLDIRLGSWVAIIFRFWRSVAPLWFEFWFEWVLGRSADRRKSLSTNSGRADSNRRRPAWEFEIPLANPCHNRTYVPFLGQE